MPARLFRSLRIFLLALLCASACPALATHIVGGEVSYKYFRTDQIDGDYLISLSIYEDCLNGNPAFIALDDPAFAAVYDGDSNLIYFDSVHFVSSITVPPNFNTECINNAPAMCLLKKTFLYNFYLPPNATGYTFVYQRCCRNSALANIVDPSNVGATYYCSIPPVSVVSENNSAVFNNYPPQIICINTPFIYNHSATDPDGDSLTYELCSAYSCLNGIPDNQPPDHPPFQEAIYVSPPYSYANPLLAYPALQIDAKTGIISGTPNRLGRYLVTVCCHEWRHGVMINTVQREFQFVVTDCSKIAVADIPVLSSFPNTYEMDCRDHTLHFINTSTGGTAWLWDFGIAGGPGDTSFEPTFTYPDTGIYSVKLLVNPGTPCTDSIIRQVRVYPLLRADFSNEGNLCPGSPVTFLDQSIVTIKPETGWQWFFGDGAGSQDQKPAHSYAYAGTYNAMFVAQNIKQCIDTVVRQVVIDNFHAFAGNDTVIVKGESVQFHATGGTEYAWSPAYNLDNTAISDPTGYYPDTGSYTYYVQVQSAFGCSGYDTVTVSVVNLAAFYVPTAFTPNGDGRNDIFRPVAIGYRGLKSFRVMNRWGQEVYYGTSLEAGWDGTYNDKKADIGAYFWEISFTDRFGKDGFLKGNVTLMR